MKRTFALIATALLTTVATAQAVELPPSDGSDTLACRSARGELEGRVNPNAVSPQLMAALNRKDAQRRQSAQVACDQIKREQAAERREWDAAQAAEVERRKVEAELNRKRQEQAAVEAKEQARIANLPINRLFRGYQFFAHVKWCNDIREGYLVKYVNDVELERAHVAIKAIADKATKDDASINTDEVWQKALDGVRGMYGSIPSCQNSLNQLLNMSPTPVITIAKP